VNSSGHKCETANQPSSTSIGEQGEASAISYLIKHNLRLVEQNFRAKQGEIDLIMKEQETLVFIEVRLRSQSSHGSSLESITRAKQRRIIHTATLYLLQEKLYDQVDCRFDVIGIDGEGEITWIKDAFQ